MPANQEQIPFLSEAPVECPASLLSMAKKCAPMRVAVVNATSPLVLESIRLAYNEDLIDPILVGASPAIEEASQAIEWDVGKFEFESADGEFEAARVATSLAANGEVDGLLKGAVHTDVLMRAVLDRTAGLRTDRLLSHVFHMTIPGNDRALCIADAVLNIAPTLQQKVEILKNSISLLAAIGNPEVKVAVLAASETESSAMPATIDAAEICRRAESGEFPGAVVEGPLAFDLAVSSEAAKMKGIEDSVVSGHADLLLVPNIETGNALFKMMVYFMSAAAAGIILGAKVPIMLTSRADPAAARLASIALASIYTEAFKP